MNFNKDKIVAFQLSIELYNKLIALQQEESLRVIRKKDVFEQSHLQTDLTPRSHCYFCEYAFFKEKERCGREELVDEEAICSHCPVKRWGNEDEDEVPNCCSSSSPYFEWTERTTEEFPSIPKLMRSLFKMKNLLETERDKYVNELLDSGVKEESIKNIMNNTKISTFRGFK